MWFTNTKRTNQRSKITFPEGDNVLYKLLSFNLDGSMELTLMNLLPPNASSMDPVSHIGEEIAFVLEGQCAIIFK